MSCLAPPCLLVPSCIPPHLLGEVCSDGDAEMQDAEEGTNKDKEEDEAALAKAAAQDNDPADLPYTRLAKSKGFQPGPHEDFSLHNLDADKVLGTSIDAPLMAACEAARQQVNCHMQKPHIQRLSEAMHKGLRNLAASKVQRAQMDELQGRAQAFRTTAGETVGQWKRYEPSADEEIPIDLSNTPQKVQAATKRLSEPSIPAPALGDGICLNLDQVLDKAMTAMKEAQSAAPNTDPTSYEKVGLDVLRNELISHHKAKKSDQTLSGFGMSMSQTLDKLAAAVNMAVEKGAHEVAVKLMRCSEKAMKEIDTFMTVANALGFKESKRLYLSIGNPFSRITRAQWENIVAASTNAEYREALRGLGDASPTPAVKIASHKRRRQRRSFTQASSSSEDSSSDEESNKQRKRRKGNNNSPPGRKPVPFCTHCRKKGHKKSDCFKLKKSKESSK